jgi:hypothetical protein
VALFVLGMFFINAGLVQSGVIDKFAWPYYLLMAPLIYVQVRTIQVMLKLDRKLLRPTQTKSVGPDVKPA